MKLDFKQILKRKNNLFPIIISSEQITIEKLNMILTIETEKIFLEKMDILEKDVSI